MCVTLGSTALLNAGKLNWLKRRCWRAAQMTWSIQWSHNVTQQQALVTFPHWFRLIHLDKWCSSACGNSRVMVPAAQTSLFKIWDDEGRGTVLETRDPVSLSLKHVLFQLESLSLMFIVSQLCAVLWSCWSTSKQTFSDGTISVYMNLIAHMKVKEKRSPHQNRLECKVQLNS